jgi:ribosome biogenesis GTPase
MKPEKDSSEKKSKRHKKWVACPLEDDYFGDERKVHRLERKMASKHDRSKYKKTDQDQQAKLEAQRVPKFHENSFEKGRVISIVSQGNIVMSEGKEILCTLKGLLKKDRSQAKNLVTVGDFVLFERTSEGEGIIVHVEPRKTILSRADNLSRRKEQLIASNIDQVLITTSVLTPPLKPSLVDRYIIAAQKGGMEPIILINKVDLLEGLDASEDPLILQEKELFEDFVKGYRQIGLCVIPVSTITGEGVEALHQVMTDKSSVFSGQSGVGKSSLINTLLGSSIPTGQVVHRTKKGAHTTTTTRLIPLAFGGWCVDTPGIKSFGVWDLGKEELESYFAEIYETGHLCKYPNCSHLHEQDCAVKDAVEEGKISLLRYESYHDLLYSISQKHLRR